MTVVKFSANPEWEKQSGDTSECNECTDPIYGNMYVLVVSYVMGDHAEKHETGIKFCESCYEAMKNEQ